MLEKERQNPDKMASKYINSFSLSYVVEEEAGIGGERELPHKDGGKHKTNKGKKNTIIKEKHAKE